MPFLSKIISLWSNLFHRRQVERDLNDELQAYVDEMAERKIQAGISPETAREQALLELGGLERIKDLVRQQRIGFGNLQRSGVIVVVALVAFVSGVSTAAGVMHWSVPAPVGRHDIAVALGNGATSLQPVRVLEGRVVDEATGQPIPHVEVGLRATSPSRRYTFTDETGRFAFSNPPSQPYGLEAGTQRWTINQSGDPYLQPASDSFEFVTPSAVLVKNKDGQPLEGEPSSFRGTGVDGKPYPPAGHEFRRFRYSRSVVELRAGNLSPGKVAKR